MTDQGNNDQMVIEISTKALSSHFLISLSPRLISSHLRLDLGHHKILLSHLHSHCRLDRKETMIQAEPAH